MRFSIWPNSSRSWDELVATAQMADRDGWYGVWYADHYMPNTEDGSPADGPLLEAWTALPALAVSTSRVRLGPLVSPTSIHHPALLANRAASMDRISGGRFVLGLGAGWQVNEHHAYGFDLEPPKERVDRFEEALEIVRSLLEQPRTTFLGRHYRITDAPMDPKPVQARLPILVGTSGARMLRITARYADQWNTWGDPATVRHHVARLDQACEEVGREPGELRRSAQALVFVVEDDGAVEAMRDRLPEGRSIIGTVSQLVDVIGEYAAAGIDELIVPDFTLGREQARREDRYALFWNEIAAAHRD